MLVKPDGPIPARLMIVGEAPGAEEETRGVPFVGASGQELNRMLHEAGIMRSEALVTNVCLNRPENNYIGHWIALKKKDVTAEHRPLHDRMVREPILTGYAALRALIAEARPRAIIACGNLALWALSGPWGIVKWRGSQLPLRADLAPGSDASPVVIPTYHPAAVLRQWDWRAIAVADLRRAKAVMDGTAPPPAKWDFRIEPSLEQILRLCDQLLTRMDLGEEIWLDLDIETRAGHIACIGFSWSLTDAICIPLMSSRNREGFWSLDEEALIVFALQRLFQHPRVRVRWQNGLYDAQYIWRHWHFVPHGAQDTMISQHSVFSSQPKSLAFQSSMYSPHYVYWKDEGKTWGEKQDERVLWSYNCTDCVRTREVGEEELRIIEKMGLKEVHDFQQELFWPVLRAMQIGLRVDHKKRGELAMELQEEISNREQYFIDVLGHPLNPQSAPQMQRLFYDDFGLKPILKKELVEGRMVLRPTLDDDALSQLATREPLLRPLITAIQDHRTLNVLLSTFVNAKLDYDGRMRCSFNIGGSESGASAPNTFRLSSSKNAFNSGANLQNIPSDKSKAVGKAMKRGQTFHIPNIRSLYIPDPGYTFFDMDLDRADLQVVVWESGEPDFKRAMRMGVDLHLWNAYVLQGKEPPALEELVETHPQYKEHRSRMKYAREFAKVFCHGTNYGGGARTMAGHVGVTVHEAEKAQKIWFGAHPGIKLWHKRTEAQMLKHRMIENRFGYRWYIFDRVEGLLPEALAWVPQSTVACVINRIWVNVHKHAPEIQTLLQVHDSLAGQFPTAQAQSCKQKLLALSRIIVPYDDPLIIPTGVKTSEVSWGDCA